MTVSSAVDASAVARVVGIKTDFVDLREGNVQVLPKRIAVVGQGNSASTYSTDKRQVTSEFEAGEIYGFGSPIHLMVRSLLPTNGDGVGTVPVTVYPLTDGPSSTNAVGSITPAGAQIERGEYFVSVNGIFSTPFLIDVGDTVADITSAITASINSVPRMPVIASDNTTDVQLTSKWAGQSANAISLTIESSIVTGVTFGITQPVGGAINPDVDTALNQIGNVWETFILNGLNIDDTATLDKYALFGEGRWGALVRKPCMVFTGNNSTDLNALVAFTDARKLDRTNSMFNTPGSINLPFVIAASSLARVARLAQNNPPRDYGSQAVPSLTPGTDGEQFDYLQRDTAVKAGISTVEVRDGVVNLSDTVTFYHPDGQDVPPYRYVVDIVKLMEFIYNLDLRFVRPEWDGAPLIPDDQPTVNRSARKPKSAVAEIYTVIDGLALEAIISDPAFAKANTRAQISTTNPKRLDVATTVKISGNTNIISVDFNFGFFFGTAEVLS